MYNEEQKKEFIAFLERSGKNPKVLAWSFSKIERTEEKFGKDICEMDEVELMEVFSELSIGIIQSERSRFRAYIKYCLEKGYCSKNLLDMKEFSTKKILEALEEEKYFISREKFGQYCEKLEEEQNGTYLKTLLWCAYEGLAGNNYINLVHLRLSDFILNKDGINYDVRLYYEGVKRKVSAALFHSLEKTSKIHKLHYESRTITLNGCRYPDTIFRTPTTGSTEDNDRYRFSILFMRIRELLGNKKLTVKNLENSSLFSYIVIAARENNLDIKKHMAYEYDMTDKELNLLYKELLRPIHPPMRFSEFRYRYQSLYKNIDGEY